MKLIHQADQFSPHGRKVCVAIGMFDGVHLGHQRVLNETIHAARLLGGVSVAVTFDRHPNSVVAPPRTPPLIYPLAQRQRVVASVGIDTMLLIHFDAAFSQQTGETFVTGLVDGFAHLASICVGSDFTFGHRRSGNVALLRKLGQKFGFVVQALPAVIFGGEVVSSTRIRQAIQTGQLAIAGDLLGRPYAIAGTVVAGEQLGRKLGFPTANLAVAGLALPPNGVYAGKARLGEAVHRAVANIGIRPTVNSPKPELRLEVHLLEFSGDLYHRELEFEFVRQIRPERKFASLDDLRVQIQEDVNAAQELLT